MTLQDLIQDKEQIETEYNKSMQEFISKYKEYIKAIYLNLNQNYNLSINIILWEKNETGK